MKSLKFLAVAAAFLCLILGAASSYAQVACAAGANYTTTTAGGAITAGTTDSGNHCDDCTTPITLPFPVRIYNQGPFTTANVDSNGTLQFVSSGSTFTNVCLPQATYDATIFPHWDDLMTDVEPACSGVPGGVCGIFTSISGSAPNRIFNIEWRAAYFPGNGLAANFELRLHEADALFTVVYGTLGGGGTSATAGVQRDTGSMFTQFACNTAIPDATTVTYTCTLVPVELMGVSVE